MKKYRDNGAVGALLDEYERSIMDLFMVLESVTQAQLVHIYDSDTEDEDCRSIQTILTHIVSSGYNYALSIENKYVGKVDYSKKKINSSVSEYKDEITEMFAYTARLFAKNPKLPNEEKNEENKMLVSWGQLFDIDQLMGHAIVHILRHRRQIERFLTRN